MSFGYTLVEVNIIATFFFRKIPLEVQDKKSGGLTDCLTALRFFVGSIDFLLATETFDEVILGVLAILEVLETTGLWIDFTPWLSLILSSANLLFK